MVTKHLKRSETELGHYREAKLDGSVKNSFLAAVAQQRMCLASTGCSITNQQLWDMVLTEISGLRDSKLLKKSSVLLILPDHSVKDMGLTKILVLPDCNLRFRMRGERYR